jgi:DNA polymerase III delta prime subunit
MMSFREHIPSLELHHAYVIEGDGETLQPLLVEHLRTLGHDTTMNADHHEATFDVFTIHDAHELGKEISLLPGDTGRKIFIFTIRAFSHDAQHALLKTIEEPPSGTHFFFLIRSLGMLLDTVRSRVRIIRLSDHVSGHNTSFAEHFLASSPGERISLLTPWTKSKKDEKLESKEEVRKFLRDLEVLLASTSERDQDAYVSTLRDILFAERELSSTSPSLKLLLESIALLAPRRPMT